MFLSRSSCSRTNHLNSAADQMASVAPPPYHPRDEAIVNPLADVEMDNETAKLMVEILNENLTDAYNAQYAERLELSMMLDDEVQWEGRVEDDDRITAIKLSLDSIQSFLSVVSIAQMQDHDTVNLSDDALAHRLSQQNEAINRKSRLDQEFAREIQNRGAGVTNDLDAEGALGEQRVVELMVGLRRYSLSGFTLTGCKSRRRLLSLGKGKLERFPFE
jgi:hypothetical protein